MGALQELIEKEAKHQTNYSKYGEERFIHKGKYITLDMTITDDLLEEGILNDLIREINNTRKKLGYSITDKIKLYCPLEFSQSYIEQIKSETLANTYDWHNNIYKDKFTFKDIEMSMEIA